MLTSTLLNLTELRSIIHAQLSSTIEIVLSESWGSQNPIFRQLIRENIESRFDENLDPATLKLESRPHFKNNIGSISISHSRRIGGYIYSSMEFLGLDIEEPERVNDRLITRVSQTNELNLGLSPNELWVTKESAFKAISNAGRMNIPIKTISEITVHNATKLNIDSNDFSNFLLISSFTKRNPSLLLKSLCFFSAQKDIHISICKSE